MAKGNPIEENTTLMNGNNKAADYDESFSRFLYNKDRGTVLGRTAKSWCQITVFYIIFYSCLAAFWIACLAIFLSTLDPKVPRFYGKGTIIGINPGVGYQPWLKENPDSTLIKYNMRDEKSWQPYVKQLDDYLKKYSDTNGTRECGENDNNSNLVEDDVLPCRFDLTNFTAAGCGPDKQYGYGRAGSPCVVLSLNRLIGWQPVDYAPDSVPENVKGRYKSGSIALYCDGANNPDKEHIGRLKYIPEYGIDGRYYPYVYVPNYHQPIAMVKFESLPRNKLVLVECRAYALNIEHDITSRLGLVHFELFLEDKVVETKPEAL
ncbi:hypothetical protein V3C99_017689 [Haemonchus contortus]|uniref:Sodium/potassium-transporting ATPase subunit beta n=1 Tax=Haemonchus contortus TaxID=6289 RepID=A0A7I4Z5E8_HAECO|nr:ATPase domain containing protein [Haemonchus contortus]